MNMSKIILFSLMLLIVMNVVVAQADLTSQVNDLKAQVEGQELTGLSAKLFSNDNINIYVKMENGQQFVVGVVTKDKKVASVDVGALENPTLKIYTDEKTIAEIQSASSSVGALQLALREKRITYEAVGFMNKVRFAFISVFARLSSGSTDNKADVEEKKEEKSVDNEDKKVEANKVEEKKEEPKIVVGQTKDEVTVAGEVKPDVKSEESKKPEMVKEKEAVEVEVSLDEKKVEEVVHTVSITKDGFKPVSIEIQKGESIEWKNERDQGARLNKAMIVGTQKCFKMQSKIFNSGETFKWKFDKAETCIVVEGIDTLKLMTIVVVD